MAGQATITINGNSWTAYLANQSWELTQGLSGQASIDAGTGMLFDTGYQHLIGVTTEQMLFNLDIAFVSDELKVVEIHRNVAPGVVFTSTELARYFLEVTAGEMAAVSVGDDVTVEVIEEPVYVVSPTIGAEDIWSVITTMMPMVAIGAFGIGMSRAVAGGNPGYGNPGYGSPGYGAPPVAAISRERRIRLRSLSTQELKDRYSELVYLQATEPDPDRALEIAGIKEILWERGYPEYAK